MKEGILAQRYAKALFAVALDKKLLEKVRDELYDFVARLKDNAELSYFLRSPERSRAEKRQLVERVFADRYSSIFFNFLLLLIDKGRIPLYREVRQAFSALYDHYHRKVRALAITAMPMAKAELETLQADLAQAMNRALEIENRIDPAILGGIVLDIEGKILDGSVRRQLERLREVVASRRN
jgi:F-type H+-transporting ATPase subunit delta